MSSVAIAVTPESNPAHDAVTCFLKAARRQRALAPGTVAAYRTDLLALERWLAERNVPILAASHADLLDYITWRVASGARPASTSRQFYSFRLFFRHFVRNGAIPEDPSAHIVMQRVSRAPPRSLSEQEVEALLAAPVASKPSGNRDRTMLHLLYATGLRISELVNLRLKQLDLEEGLIRVGPKGGPQRLIPLGKASRVLRDFKRKAREEILLGRRTDYVFPTRHCPRMTRQAFWNIFTRYARKAGLKKGVSPNNLRNAFAAHLLARGASLQQVQSLLGHSEWSTRQIYKHIVRQRPKGLRT